MKKIFIFIIVTQLFIFISVPSWGLFLLTDTLKEFVLIDSINKNIDIKQNLLKDQPGIDIDHKQLNLFKNTTIEQFVQQNSSIFIKNLGTNGISTLNIRGSSPSQSQVLWQGIPINNIHSGLTDLSTLSTGLFDKVQIKTSGTAAVLGNATIGGALLLNSSNLDQRLAQINLGAGSFGAWNVLMKYNQPIKDGNVQAKFRYATIKNNYPYYHQNNKKILSNASREEYDFLVDFNKKIHWNANLPFLQVNINSWVHQTHKELPPAIFEKHSFKNQSDLFFRVNMDLIQNVRDYGTFQLKNAVSFEESNYNDSIAFVNQSYHSITSYHELSWLSRKLNFWKSNHELTLLLPIQNQQFTNFNTEETFQQTKIGLAGIYNLITNNKKWNFQMGIRQELINEDPTPLTYNFTANFISVDKDNYKLPVFISYQKSYRYPTLPELNVFPGGNKNLAPETGNNWEAGIHPTVRWNRGNLAYKITRFDREIKNWIYWLGVTVWTPYNIAEVNSKGWEHQLKITQNLKNWEIYSYNNYTYNIAVTKASNLPNNNSIGKQIPYAPRYLLNNTIGIRYGNIWVNIQRNYVGYTFSNLDETAFINPYSIYNAQLKYTHPILKNKLLSVQININNLTNIQYETIKYRPMPPINTNVQVSLTM